MKYAISEPVDTFGRFERRHVIDSNGDKVAILTYPVAPDPDGISGNAATIAPFSGYVSPRWMNLIDYMGKKSARGIYRTEYKGDPQSIINAIKGGAQE